MMFYVTIRAVANTFIKFAHTVELFSTHDPKISEKLQKRNDLSDPHLGREDVDSEVDSLEKLKRDCLCKGKAILNTIARGSQPVSDFQDYDVLKKDGWKITIGKPLEGEMKPASLFTSLGINLRNGGDFVEWWVSTIPNSHQTEIQLTE